MAKEPEQIVSRGDLDQKIREILVAGTLYRPFVYSGEGLAFSSTTSYSPARFGILPARFRMFCGNRICMTEEVWQNTDRGEFYFEWEMPTRVKYGCRNCGIESLLQNSPTPVGASAVEAF